MAHLYSLVREVDGKLSHGSTVLRSGSFSSRAPSSLTSKLSGLSVVHFTYHTGPLVCIKRISKVVPPASGMFYSLLTHSLPGDEGQSYKLGLASSPLSGGWARHCLLKAPCAQVQPPSRSETTDGSGLEVNIPCPLDKPCLHRDKWHEIPLTGRGETRPHTRLHCGLCAPGWRLLVHKAHSGSIPPTGYMQSGSFN